MSAVSPRGPRSVRHLVLVLGDQLNHDSSAFDGFDPRRDRVLMIEAPGEASHVWSHRARIALFLSAMRHFACELEARATPLTYIALDAELPPGLPQRLAAELATWRPDRVVVCEPGEYRVARALRETCDEAGIALEMRPDRHFLASRETFAAWAGRAATLRMESFYRTMRRRTGVLMRGDLPEGGAWNLDRDNRGSFGRQGPGTAPAPPRYEPDAITREVLALVQARFPDHPGRLASFAWPVTRAQARHALDAFIRDRLPQFGQYQDAMWSDEPVLWHSLLSSSLNLKLLDPREVIAAAEQAWRERGLPLASVEGFIRQILGWREFIRGVYWLDMPALAAANHFGHERPLPAWYWTGDTRMNCMRQAIGQTLEHGYAHHIQRLMVTGNFALLAGLSPQRVADWYLAVYIDAVEWAELPNTAGMALYANGGRFTSKPYAASGAYIQRMSNYCAGCSYRPQLRAGPQACPITVLYWSFLMRHQSALSANPRASLMVKNLQRFDSAERLSLRREAQRTIERIETL